MEKRPKNSGDKSRKKKRRNLIGNYQGNSQQNYYMAGEREDTRKKEKKDGTRIGIDGKIPRDKKT